MMKLMRIKRNVEHQQLDGVQYFAHFAGMASYNPHSSTG